ncbi:PmrA [Streptomyces decoyicus]|uniref:PmrA n=1 Tax=Streptomyces decoyicus TaxID=249567 RepID=A0ABZ1FUY0_9ACTN|nr:PmrA [Streptomyces decoyicus]WSB73742.1 PmrA [Streptomyces decoyicus]
MTFRHCWRRWPNARLPARSGTFTSMLRACSCHTSVPSLERNARPGVDAVARQVAQPDPAARRKR